VVNNPLANLDPDGKDWWQAVKIFWNGLHVSFSAGLGKASREEALGTGKRVSAQVKSTLDVSVEKGAKLSLSAETAATFKVLGVEVGPQASKPIASVTVDPQLHVTTEIGGPVEGSLARLPTGTSSSTNGKEGQLTIAGIEENVVIPTPEGPVPTPLTTGFSISVSSDAFWGALVEMILPEKPPATQPQNPAPQPAPPAPPKPNVPSTGCAYASPTSCFI
jgi:hypothetical protein